MEENSFKVTLLFPLFDNQAVPFSEEVWSALYDRLMQLFMGFTESGVVKGWWLGHSDLNREIFIIVHTVDEVYKIKTEIAQWGRKHFRQEAIYFECQRIYFEEVK